MGPLFNAAIPEEVKAIFRTRLFQRFALLESTLARQDYLLEGGFSVADVYLFTVMRWNRFFAIDLAPWPALVRFMARIGARPSVIRALEAESAQ